MARELDLTTNLRIGLNDTQVEELAVDQLIADLSTTDVMLQWILKYIMENISEDKAWNIISQIKNFGHTIFRDDYKAVSRQLEQKMQEEGFFEDYTRRLRELRQMAVEHMKEVAASFFDALEGEDLTIDDLANKSRGIAGFFLKLQKGIFDPSIENASVANCLGNSEKWCAKSHPRRELIISLAEGTLGDILRYAVGERPRQWKLYKSADLTLRHLNQLRLLSSIEQKVHELNESANRFLLSDTQQLLHSLIGESDSPFIFEKIGTQLEHVMIDEFQDTSTVQWQNFRVLLAEAMSHEGSSNLIVGDVKQSIYRWRSGDWRLLNDIEQQFNAQQIETLPLKTNYRSERGIITFNNAFFRQAADLEYATQRELGESEAKQLQRAYADVEQLIPAKRQSGGYVDIRLLPGSDDYQELTLQHMMPQVTIVSDEAFRLDASQAVCLLVNALRLLIHPDDLLTKAAIVRTYHCDVLGEHDEENELLLSTTDLDSHLPEDYIAHFNQLLSLPLYDLVERLYAIFGLETLDTQSAYVSAFYDRLSDYVNENATDISDFLREWDETLCSKTIQSDENEGVRIFSIHKSKGLEYDHVIIPFCDWTIERSGNILWCTPTEEPFSDLPIAPIDYSQKQMMGTIYEQDYLHEHLQNTVDNLNLLYVAFTRACKSLYVIGRRGGKNTRSALIEQCLPLIVDKLEAATLEGLEDEKGVLHFAYPHSTTDISPSSFLLPPSSKNTSQNPFLQPSDPINVAVRTFASKVNFQQSNRSRNFVEGDDEDAKQRRQYIQTGSVLHEIFSTIRTAADIPDALQRLQFEGVLYDENITTERIKEMLKKRLEHPRVRDWFSNRWTLFNECTILSVEDGQLHERRPDRVMTDGHEWIIVDFKFGAPHPEYHDQVREYMQLLASMGHQHISGYLWYVYSNRIEEVKD